MTFIMHVKFKYIIIYIFILKKYFNFSPSTFHIKFISIFIHIRIKDKAIAKFYTTCDQLKIRNWSELNLHRAKAEFTLSTFRQICNSLKKTFRINVVDKYNSGARDIDGEMEAGERDCLLASGSQGPQFQFHLL